MHYVYGAPAERLVAQVGTSPVGAACCARTQCLLGSLRATLSDAGIPQAAASYDAWDVPETPLIGSFGFTGELQQGSDVWLRARWYGAGRGSFGSRDPFEGMAQTPYSMQYYQYGYSNPVSNRDPSGRDPGNPPHPMNTPCTLFSFNNLTPSNPCQYPTPTPKPSPTPIPATGVTPRAKAETSSIIDMPNGQCLLPIVLEPPEDIGYIQGYSVTVSSNASFVRGYEVVLDLYDFEAALFYHETKEGFAVDIGASASLYRGTMSGWSFYHGSQRGIKAYEGPTIWKQQTVNLPFKGVSVSHQEFTSLDGNIHGSTIGVGLGISMSPIPGSISNGISVYTIASVPFVFRKNPDRPPRVSDGEDFVRFLQTTDLDTADMLWATRIVRRNAARWEQYDKYDVQYNY